MNLDEILFGRVRGMHHVNRYSSVPLIRAENVAEHSWQVSFIAYLIGMDLRNQGVTVAMEQMLCRAIVHDLDESTTGDIIRSFKYHSPEITAAMKTASREIVYALGKKIDAGIGNAMYEDWNDAKDGIVEGQIIALADMLCVVSKCVEEYKLGNRAVNYILRSMYEENLKDWHDRPYVGQYVNALFPNRRWSDPIDRS